MTADVADIDAARVAKWVRMCDEWQSKEVTDAFRFAVHMHCYNKALEAGLVEDFKAALYGKYRHRSLT
ncbi:MAG: hypothetical protein WKH97_12725 [Casimicrobiaceae bacterium]